MIIVRQLRSFFSSAKLATALLIAILVSCLVGVTVFTYSQAVQTIFSTLWFNGLLVLLVTNVSVCFFGRIRGRKITMVSLGMILFHLSFVAMLCGIVYNSLFYFRGMIRLTEGETLPSGSAESYDAAESGRFFSYKWLRGETSLVKLHAGYKVDGADKRVAYEISVGEGRGRKHGVIYVTRSLTQNGFTYYNDQEGYSILVILRDGSGRELYGAHIPLQSLKQKNDTYIYTTGTKDGPGFLPFPANRLSPLFDLQMVYEPDAKKERGGDVVFRMMNATHGKQRDGKVSPEEAKAKVGQEVHLGGYTLTAQEVRYWVAMTVRFEPGKPVVLASLWVGLAGMVITFIGRLRGGRKQQGND